MASRRLHEPPRGPLEVPRKPQEGPRAAQETPKRTQERPRASPRRPQDGSKSLPTRCSFALKSQLVPRRPQETSKRAQKAPRCPQEAPRRLPKGPQQAPKGSQEALKSHPSTAFSLQFQASDRCATQTAECMKRGRRSFAAGVLDNMSILTTK